MIRRYANDPKAKEDIAYASIKAFNTIGYALTTDSPNKSKDYRFLEKNDFMVMSRDRLIAESDKMIASKKENYLPPIEPTFNLPGSTIMPKMIEILENLLELNKIKEHGMVVGKNLGFMLSGGNTDISNSLSEKYLLDLEREIFIDLIQMPLTQDRIKYTLATGKPLIN